MNSNSKICYIIFVLAIVTICLVLYRRKIATFNNPIYQKLSENEKTIILDRYLEFNNLDHILKDEVVIKRLKDSSQLVIQNLTDTQNLLDFYYQKSFGTRGDLLEYQLRDLENTNSMMSSMLVTHGQSTTTNNQKYGFILKVTEEKYKPQHNLGEFCVEFTASKQEQLNLLPKIKEIKDSINYKNQPRKTVNLFTQYNAPADIQPYFTKGTHGKDIKTVIRFLDATNIDYLRNFPDGRFNILDNNLNPILTYCKLDVPFCGVNLKPQGNIKGRDKFVTGKFNHLVGEYTIVDSQEHTNYKMEKTLRQQEELKKTAEAEIAIIKEKKPTYDMLTFNQKKMVREYDSKFYQELVIRKKNELLARKDKNLSDMDIKFISENDLQDEFDAFMDTSKVSITEGFTNELIYQTQNKYRNMEEHFSNDVTSFQNLNDPSRENSRFSGEKYLEYQEYEKCMSKKNRDANTDKLVSKNYSPILTDNLMLKKDKSTFDKIREKMGFKCRKHHREKDNRYYYGGIDFDGQTKCYGDNNSCKIFENEKSCLDLDKELNKVEAFTGSNTIEHFSNAFQEEKDTIYRLSFMRSGKKYYLKKGLDIFRQAKETSGTCGPDPFIKGECAPKGRFTFDHTENADEAIGFGFDKKGSEKCLFFLHRKSKYHIIYQFEANQTKDSNGKILNHNIFLAPNHLKTRCVHLLSIGGDKYYLLDKYKFALEYDFENKRLNRHEDKNYGTKFSIEKDNKLTEHYKANLSIIQAKAILSDTIHFDQSDTSVECHNYRAIREIENSKYDWIRVKFRLNKNFEFSFTFKYKSLFPVKAHSILDLRVPKKYHSNLEDSYIRGGSDTNEYNDVLEFKGLFAIYTHWTDSSKLAIRARTEETSLLIPEGKTTKEKYNILLERERKLNRDKPEEYYSHIWAGFIGEDDPKLEPGNDYHFRVVYYKNMIEVFMNGERILYKPSLESKRRVYDDISLTTNKRTQYFEVNDIKYVNLDDTNENIRCDTEEMTKIAQAKLLISREAEIAELEEKETEISQDISKTKQNIDTSMMTSKQALEETIEQSKKDVAITTDRVKKDFINTVDTAKEEVKSLKVEQQQTQILQNKKLLQIENEKKYKETIEKMRQKELNSNEQKILSDKLAGMNKLVTYDAFDSSQAGYIGADIEENYQKYNFLNCIPHEREDVTCKHVNKNLKFDMDTKQIRTENQTLVDIITLDTAQEKNIPDILQSHELLEFNKEQKNFLQQVKNLDDSALKTYIDFEMNKPIDYLIEPCYQEYKDLNSNIIFDSFKIKFRMTNIIDNTKSVPGLTEVYYTTIQIIKDNKPESYILDNTGKPIRLNAGDYIYLYLDNPGNNNKKIQKLHLEVYDNNEILKNSRTLNVFNLKGKFGDEISLFLQTNNQHIFDKILFTEQLGNIVLPYDPYVEVDIE